MVTNSFLKCFGIVKISGETFSRFQSQFVIPSINRLYEEQENAILSDMKGRGKYYLFLRSVVVCYKICHHVYLLVYEVDDKSNVVVSDKPVILTRDCRFDSPGQSARYYHYLLIDYEDIQNLI